MCYMYYVVELAEWLWVPDKMVMYNQGDFVHVFLQDYNVKKAQVYIVTDRKGLQKMYVTFCQKLW